MISGSMNSSQRKRAICSSECTPVSKSLFFLELSVINRMPFLKSVADSAQSKIAQQNLQQQTAESGEKEGHEIFGAL